MRVSCNGCRVLRKGCSDQCTIRPCLHWIKSPESQANATLFLAKFYGRAGLLNLIESGPEHLRPAIFRSLLYEACGRIVNPVDGSVGLMWSGNWAQCQAAVDAVLNGSPIPETTSSHVPASHQTIPPQRTFDIRHVAKDLTTTSTTSFATVERTSKVKNRTGRFKRPFTAKSRHLLGESSHGSWPSQFGNNGGAMGMEGQMAEGSGVNRVKPDRVIEFGPQTETGELGLELSLG